MAAGTRRLLAGAAAAGAVLAGGTLGIDRTGPAQAQVGERPNVLVVMTDDQDRRSMPVLGNVRRLIRDPGTTFSESIVSFPLCCPSRSTFLTGQYARNHGVRSGSGFKFLDSSNTLAVWLQNAGYTTAHVGKYVNGYGLRDRTEIPPGWSNWYATTGRTSQAVQNYLMNQNGELVRYGEGPDNFKGDVLTLLARNFINRNTPSPTPFFLFVGYTAPHGANPGSSPYKRCKGGAQPALRHRGAFAGTPLPRPPSFNEANVSDKHREVRTKPLLSPAAVKRIRIHHQCRLESLLSVDDGVATLVGALQAAGELDSTLIIFTSDNGFYEGQHRLPGGKLYAYEEALRVPLLMRGPGVPAGKSVKALAANIDLAPTILDATGVAPGLPQDGVSLYGLIAGRKRDRPVLIENSKATAAKAYSGVRTKRYAYVDYVERGRELFDLRRDKWELRSVDDKRRYRPVVKWMKKRLRSLRHCEGRECRKSAGRPPR
jgi:arylsulfatase A-like enzyme